MKFLSAPARAASAFAVFVAVACAPAIQQPPVAGTAPAPAHTATTSPETLPHTAADVQFMSGMISHHLQAIRISGWMPTHGANPALLRLGERIVVGQQDEIAIMRSWLQDRKEVVPSTDTAQQAMGGMDHSAHMPGMLSPEQLAQLDAAKGADFDRLFLTFMIVHHKGALTMVDQLFGSQASAQNDTVFRIAADIQAEQTTEINRMQQMLDALPARAESR